MEEKRSAVKNTKLVGLFSRKNLLIAFFTITALVSVGCLFFAKFYLKSYQLLNDRQLVAIVECAGKKDKFLDVKFFPDTEKQLIRRLPFDADEWVIEGRIVKWKPLLGVFGVNNYYKLERISGRYFDIEKEKHLPRQVYALCESPDKIWLLLYKYQKLLPFIDAVYGNSAFIRFEPGAKYQVYITSTGFMIKDVTVNTKKSWWFTG